MSEVEYLVMAENVTPMGFSLKVYHNGNETAEENLPDKYRSRLYSLLGEDDNVQKLLKGDKINLN